MLHVAAITFQLQTSLARPSLRVSIAHTALRAVSEDRHLQTSVQLYLARRPMITEYVCIKRKMPYYSQRGQC